MTETPKGLHAKLAEVMAEASRIPKRGKAPVAMGGYPFVQVGDAADAIRSGLGERGVSMLPTTVELTEQAEHDTKSGGTMTTVTVRTTWTLTDGETGQTATIQSLGTGADTGDKYTPKAQTNAMKYALLMGFLLSTGDDPESSATEERQAKGAMIERDSEGGLIGTAEAGDKQSSDFQLRQTPDGPSLGFRLRGERGGILVECHGDLAVQLDAFREPTIGQRVTAWGTISDREWTPKGAKRPVMFQVLAAERVRVPGIGDLPTVPTTEPVAEEAGLSEADSVAIWNEIERIGA